MKKEGFPRSARITRRRDFTAALRRGKRIAGGTLILVLRKSAIGHSRVAIVAGRKAGIAAERNRVKRIVREYFRTKRAEFPEGFDSVVMAQPGVAELSNREIRSLLASCLTRARRAVVPQTC